MADINDGTTRAWSDDTVDGFDFDNDAATEDFNYTSDPVAPASEAPAAGYDDDNFGGIVAPEPLIDDKPQKSKTVPVLAGIAAALAAAVVGLIVWSVAKASPAEPVTPPVTPTQTTTATVTETKKVPDDAAAKKAQGERDAARRDRDRYRDQTGSLRRQNESLKNKPPATVTRTAPPTTVTRTDNAAVQQAEDERDAARAKTKRIQDGITKCQDESTTQEQLDRCLNTLKNS